MSAHVKIDGVSYCRCSARYGYTKQSWESITKSSIPRGKLQNLKVGEHIVVCAWGTLQEAQAAAELISKEWDVNAVAVDGICDQQEPLYHDEEG